MSGETQNDQIVCPECRGSGIDYDSLDGLCANCCATGTQYSHELIKAVGQISEAWEGVGAFRFARPHRYPAGTEAIWVFLRTAHEAFPEGWLGFPIVKIVGGAR